MEGTFINKLKLTRQLIQKVSNLIFYQYINGIFDLFPLWENKVSFLHYHAPSLNNIRTTFNFSNFLSTIYQTGFDYVEINKVS
jgi:hypothetical protein